MDPTAENHQVLHSFCTYPDIAFESQSPGETVVLLLRRHPFTQISWVVTAFVLALLPLIGDLFIQSYVSISQLIFLNLFWYAGVFAYIYLNFISWLFNVGIITTRRIVDVDFSNVLYKEITVTVLSKIEDSTIKEAGFIGSLLNFGDVFIQTAGSTENIEFVEVPKPNVVVGIINNLMGK
jgi:hypothetical protein